MLPGRTRHGAGGLTFEACHGQCQMNAYKLPVRQSRLRARAPGGDADYEEEEIDEVESLPREIEHDEEERDPDPERGGVPSEHAQEQRHERQPGTRHGTSAPR
ncbi:hypothetical protein [Janthinobacterium sp. 17J80-10]|uniref:hypothetical protein n=1 Tax=Janthinobacterium sp. 17J80-10 TaxID=2497863 RepID=UPI0010057C40|nr:hypothetical protein [Janthinobacterium sp. 17J80-10]QAU32834.1 hypothetical protein EKL02_00850 [Janthinobacterium sp. 17J80-10]